MENWWCFFNNEILLYEENQLPYLFDNINKFTEVNLDSYRPFKLLLIIWQWYLKNFYTDISCSFRGKTDQAKRNFIVLRELRCKRTSWFIPGHMRGVQQSWDMKPDAAQATSPSPGALTEAQCCHKGTWLLNEFCATDGPQPLWGYWKHLFCPLTTSVLLHVYNHYSYCPGLVWSILYISSKCRRSRNLHVCNAPF